MCLLVFLGILLIAVLSERFWIKTHKISPARRVSYIGIFSAVAALLMYFEISLPFAPPFYQIDLSEVPVFICSFSLGPVAGVVCELLKIIIKLFLKGTSTAFVGDFANFVVGCSFVLPATIVYHCVKTKKGALIGMAAGTLVMTVFGSLFNALYLIPAFSKLYGLPLEAIIGMGTEVNKAITDLTTLVLFAVVPFNLLKGVLVSFLTFLLYKRIERLLKLR
ncbi:MAG: ECF transporter S component [Ruminococcaceae bacterium]|nr:ECF transporter S component [Oscillospiraceae bacterium]